MSFSNELSTLLLAAEAYSALGYVVIPLLGSVSTDRPKAPAVPWNDYQKRKPRPDELRRWFLEDGYQALGILTGRCSGLVVLDFDTPDLFKDFRAQFPDLADCSVIQTRRGFHIYYRLPAHLTMASRAGQGVDLLSDGRYVVARPTTIAGFTYKLIRGGQPKMLTPRDISRINSFLDKRRNSYVTQPQTFQPAPSTQLPQKLTVPDLQALYRHHLKQGKGRNESLFFTALAARDHGNPQPHTLEALGELHSKAVATDHTYQDERQRWMEARRTIASAYSRPARPAKPSQTSSQQLPNRVREALYLLKLTCVIRVIEGLREKGIQPDQTFTREMACNLLSGLVGRFSIDKALHANTSTGQRLFETAKPPCTPHRYAASHSDATITPQCLMGSVPEPEISRKGRPTQHYHMPTNEALSRLLGVSLSTSDLVGIDDLSSARKTRLAAHRAFLQRRPGQYPRRWLAARLGVSRTTTRRYDLALQVQVKAMFYETSITWHTLNRLPDFAVGGAFLTDETGKRYPARREIALKLLHRGHQLVFCRQDANFYSLDPPQVAAVQVIAREQVWRDRQRQIEARITVEQGRGEKRPEPPPETPRLPRATLPIEELPVAKDNSSTPIRNSYGSTVRRYRQPLPNAAQEALAQHIYKLLNTLTADNKHYISHATARRCVAVYGVSAVRQAIQVLSTRKNVSHPVGLFLSLLRSSKPT